MERFLRQLGILFAIVLAAVPMLIGTAYYYLFYIGTPCGSEKSPDGRYTIEYWTSFRFMTMPGDGGGCHAGYIRLRASTGRLLKEVYTGSVQETKIEWDRKYDAVSVDSIWWLLPSRPGAKPSSYLQHRLNLMVENGDIDAIDRLMRDGADLNALDEKGRLPLVVAAFNKHLKVINYLLANGADVNGRDNDGNTALHWSAVDNADGNVVSSITKVLVENGADVNARDNEGQTPLHTGIRSLDDVVYLVKHGADPAAKDADGRPTIVNYASDLDVVQYLLSRNAEIDYHAPWVPDFLYQAIIGQNVDLLRLFERKGADVGKALSIRDAIYPLHHAASHGNIDSVAYQLEHHADINEKDEAGRTPLEVVRNELKNDWFEGPPCEEFQREDGNVYCNTRRDLEKMADFLVRHGAQRTSER